VTEQQTGLTMTLNKNTLNRSFLHALVAGILLSPISFMLDVAWNTGFLRMTRLAFREPVAGLAFVLTIWLAAVGLAWGLELVLPNLRLQKPLSKFQKDGVIVLLLLPLLLVMLLIKGGEG
jgi:hypothetical protein